MTTMAQPQILQVRVSRTRTILMRREPGDVWTAPDGARFARDTRWWGSQNRWRRIDPSPDPVAEHRSLAAAVRAHTKETDRCRERSNPDTTPPSSSCDAQAAPGPATAASRRT